MSGFPFFIIGCGRSGTSLLRKMLNGHADLAVPLESLFILDYIQHRGEAPLATFRDLARQEFEVREWGIEVRAADLADCRDVPELIDRLHRLYMLRDGKTRWGQKTPRLVRIGGQLKEAFPAARFIHVVRDPRAVVSSLIQSPVHHSNALYGARRWLKDVQAGCKLQQLFPASVLEIRYEDLVAEPAATLGGVCAFLEVPFDAAMLDFAHQGQGEYSDYYAHLQKLNQPLDPARIQGWRRNLSRRQIALIEDVCGPLMENLGYETEEEATRVPGAYRIFLHLERALRGVPRQFWAYFSKRRGYLHSYFRRQWRLGGFRGFLRRMNQ